MLFTEVNLPRLYYKISPVMASYFDELHVDEAEDEIDYHRSERLTRETFRMLFEHDPARYGDLMNFQITPPASKLAVEKLNTTPSDDLLGKYLFVLLCPLFKSY